METINGITFCSEAEAEALTAAGKLKRAGGTNEEIRAVLEQAGMTDLKFEDEPVSTLKH